MIERTPQAVAVHDVEMADMGDLKPHPQNYRTHPEDQLEHLAASIREHGFYRNVVVASDGTILAGHGVYEASQLVGLKQIPVTRLSIESTSQQAIKILAADNTVSHLAQDDDRLLAELLKGLGEMDDLLGTGWDQQMIANYELTDLMADDYPTPDADPVDGERLDTLPDDVPAITKPGEVVTLGRHTLTCGDCLEVLRSLPESSVDAVVTDPPYGIGFMGKDWDCDVPGDAFAVEALRVLKPGGHLIAFAATRTVHRLTVAIEDAGFEIRDQIAWLQWQGFPKSHDVSKAIDQHHGAEREVVGRQKLTGTARRGVDGSSHGAARTNAADKKERQPTTIDLTAPATPDAEKWNGWGTALKPSYEPAVLARKPLDGTVADNVLAHGTGGINVDGCRIGYGDQAWPGPGEKPEWEVGSLRGNVGHKLSEGNNVRTTPPSDIGRWPANIYACPKASRGEREVGCDELPQVVSPKLAGAAANNPDPLSQQFRPSPQGNHHPTVKPVKLMRWLVRLVTPPGGTVVEPFCGSGTTLIAAEAEGLTCVAVEREPGYCDIIRARYEGVIRDD